MFKILTVVQCGKRRALGSEILWLSKKSIAKTLHTGLPGCLKGLLYSVKKFIPLYSVKKFIPCKRRVHTSHLHRPDFDVKTVNRLNQWSQQDGYLPSGTMLSHLSIIGF